MTSSPAPAPSGRLTVNQLVRQLLAQVAQGRGDHEILILPTGGRKPIRVLTGFVSGLPEEMGAQVGFYVVPR